jgi:hypothetical protein
MIVRPPPKREEQAGLWHGMGSRTLAFGFVSKFVPHEVTHACKEEPKPLYGTGTARLSVGLTPRLGRRTHAAPAYPNPDCVGRTASVISKSTYVSPCACSDAYY